MAKVAVLSQQVYTAGVHVIPDVAIPTGISRCRMTFDLTALTSLTLKMDIATDISQDNGANWVFSGGAGLDLNKANCTLVNGVLTDSRGNPVVDSGIILTFANPASSTRKLRGSITLTEDFNTSVSIELS